MISSTNSPQQFAIPKVISSTNDMGEIILRSAYELPQPARCLGDLLVQWAGNTPDSIFLADRLALDGSWQHISYSEMLRRVRELAGWLIDTGVSVDRPIAILSENSIDHAVLAFAGMHIGVPVATISNAYSLMSQDHETLKAMIEKLDPAIIYVSNMEMYGDAITSIDDHHKANILCSSKPSTCAQDAILLTDAIKNNNQDRVDKAFGNITPDTIARLLFTSGSTGTPKAVINTHLMLTSNQEANLAVCPFLKDKPPRLVDWLPWSHTFGCNYCLNLVLRNGGAMYIDEGKPAPHLISKSIRNIKEIKPNMYFNVPRGFDMLLQALEDDAQLREVFFDMELIFYAAASLSNTTWDRLLEMSIETTGKAIPLVAAWGATETAPLATYCHFQSPKSGNIGVPVPGTVLKLTPNGDKLEVRAKGPNVTLGYYKDQAKTKTAFDEEGFYIMGDAVRLADPDDPAKGLFFDGRVSEDFKLNTGTWVSVGELRIAGIDALHPLAQDIVVVGHDSDEVGFLIFPNEIACRKISGLDKDAPLDAVLKSEHVQQKILDGLIALKNSGGGSSRYATRVRFLNSVPNPDAGEITDKAYLNQRRTLANRHEDVALLQGNDPAYYIAI